MAWYWIVLIFYAVITGVIAVVGGANNDLDSIPYLINPVEIYKENNVNIFGCILLTLLGHLMFPYYAIIYWIYKLCTIGR